MREGYPSCRSAMFASFGTEREIAHCACQVAIISSIGRWSSVICMAIAGDAHRRARCSMLSLWWTGCALRRTNADWEGATIGQTVVGQGVSRLRSRRVVGSIVHRTTTARRVRVATLHRISAVTIVHVRRHLLTVSPRVHVELTLGSVTGELV